MTTARRLMISTLACLALVAVAMSRPSEHVDGMGAAQASPAASPAVLTNSGRYLPAAEAIGEGWSVASTGVLPSEPEIFVDTASAIYLGPAGSRVIVMVWTNLPGRAAVQRSWETVGFVYEDYRYAITGYYDDGREAELAALPLPEGCVDARRLDGADRLYNLPGAMTQCAVDPDVTVLVVLSGSVDGLTGFAASDRLATLSAQAGQP